MKARPIETVQEGDRLIALVPLGRSDLKAEMWRDDYDFLVKLGLSPNWSSYRNVTGNYVTASAVDTPSKHVLVARVLMDAGAGQVVRYADGNPLNLRRGNLRLVANGKGKTRARDFVKDKTFLEINR